MNSPVLRVVQTLDFGADVWRADALAANTQAGQVLATGHAQLDAELPGGGWPVGALCEILQSHSAQSEWRLLLPTLVAAQQRQDPPNPTGRQRLQTAAARVATVVLINPPHVPFGPALAAKGLDLQHLVWVKAQQSAQCLWATEQALCCSAVVAVLAWLPQAQSVALRRLHMGAQTHAKLLFVMRPALAQRESSPAPLRLLLLGGEAVDRAELRPAQGLSVQLLKRRGPPLNQALVLDKQSRCVNALDRFAA